MIPLKVQSVRPIEKKGILQPLNHGEYIHAVDEEVGVVACCAKAETNLS